MCSGSCVLCLRNRHRPALSTWSRMNRRGADSFRLGRATPASKPTLDFFPPVGGCRHRCRFLSPPPWHLKVLMALPSRTTLMPSCERDYRHESPCRELSKLTVPKLRAVNIILTTKFKSRSHRVSRIRRLHLERKGIYRCLKGYRCYV